MTLEEYIKYRTGETEVHLIVRNLLFKPFFSNSFRSFWHYWNPGYGYFLLFFCYKPMRNLFPHWISVIITFLLCGFLHDILYIIPIIFANGLIFIFPFVTVWFFIISIGILLTDFLQFDFQKVKKTIRPIFHFGYIIGTFCLTRFIDLLLFQ